MSEDSVVFQCSSDLESLNTTSEKSYESNLDYYCSSTEKKIPENLYNKKNYYLINNNYNEIQEKFNQIITILGDKRTELNYPQITVVGDQSSGKSTLLETIFNIKLPTATGTCTKCPIVIKSKNINLKEKKYKLESDNIIEEIDEENICERIKDLQNIHTQYGNLVSNKEIILQIEGSDLLDITIVDLPGIIHDGEKDVETIQDTIKKYIKQDNTLILVVNPATSDEELNTAQKLAKTFDDKKKRTMTIYTKCDILDTHMITKEEKEEKCKKINDADNTHAVICKNKDGINYNEKYELTILEKYNISEEKSGINNLKKKLENTFCELIKVNAPEFEKNIVEKIYKCKEDLSKLGERNKEKSEIVRDIKNIFLKEFDTKELKQYFMKFKELIKIERDNNTVEEFVENNFKFDIFRVPCFQGEDTFNERLEFICGKYIDCGFKLKEDIENYLRNLFSNITLNFVDENSNAIIYKYVNDKLDNIMSTFEKEFIKEINKEKEFNTINHYFEDNGEIKELEDIIDDYLNNNNDLVNSIKNMFKNYKEQTLEERQKKRIIDCLTDYENHNQNKKILDNILSVIQIYIKNSIIEWINDDLCEFIRDNDDIKEDDKIRQKRISLNQDINKYKECLDLLKN